jgi:hypothetical protein
MAFFSDSQSPKSIIRQRSLQNGFHLEASIHGTDFPQCGQGTVSTSGIFLLDQ